MELAIREAKARLSELTTAARNGGRVVITKYGRPPAELVRRASGAPDRNELADVVAETRLASMCARRSREDSIA